MRVQGFESLVLYVGDLARAKSFYVDALGLSLIHEDEVIAVVGDHPCPIVLHRNDRGHDDRGIWPAGFPLGAAALRFAVPDPDEGQAEAETRASRAVAGSGRTVGQVLGRRGSGRPSRRACEDGPLPS
jgi:catechol 2,3-dioxygenase-like lactoylglutathione lyase family enzyme